MICSISQYIRENEIIFHSHYNDDIWLKIYMSSWSCFFFMSFNDNFHSDSLLNFFFSFDQLSKANTGEKEKREVQKKKRITFHHVCRTTSLKTSLDSNRCASSSYSKKKESEKISLSLSFSLSFSLCLIMHLIWIGSKSSCTREKKKKKP